MTRPEPIRFASGRGHSLAARFDPPVGPGRGLAIFAHCFTCSKDLLAARRVAEGLAQRGIGVLRFDFTGLGHSEGEFANSGFTSNVEDLVAAAAWLQSRHGPVDLLVGHSLGGAAALAAAGSIDSVRGVAVIGAPADPSHAGRLFGESRAEIEARGRAQVTIAGRSFEVDKSLVDDLYGHKLLDAVAGLRKDILILHAPLDQVVGIENASAIFGAARHPKSFISLGKADHLLSDAADAAFAADMIAAWAGRLLPSRQSQAGEGQVVVETLGEELFPHLASAGPNWLVVDEPRAVGGFETGMTPYQLVLAGLGACTAMTMRMYAKRKNWPLPQVRVSLRHAKEYVRDCEGCEDAPVKLDVIDREIGFGGDFDEEQRARLMEIADRCPVHRTLESDIRIRTRRADDDGG